MTVLRNFGHRWQNQKECCPKNEEPQAAKLASAYVFSVTYTLFKSFNEFSTWGAYKLLSY